MYILCFLCYKENIECTYCTSYNIFLCITIFYLLPTYYSIFLPIAFYIQNDVLRSPSIYKTIYPTLKTHKTMLRRFSALRALAIASFFVLPFSSLCSTLYAKRYILLFSYTSFLPSLKHHAIIHHLHNAIPEMKCLYPLLKSF
jgi:hypothetical protein